MKWFSVIFILTLVLVVGCTQEVVQEQPIKDTEPVEQVEEKYENVLSNLFDVTKGEDVRGINTNGESFGMANASFKNNTYSLVATFGNLPDPVGDDFYEGWVVRKGVKFSVVSTGELTKENGVYTNTFTSDKDLTDHSFYVLTLEPNDGDPAPADHIVEGDVNTE